MTLNLSGKNPTDDYLEAMMNEAPGPINFTMFLTMFGEKLNGTDPEDVIRNAFACFDEEGTGKSTFVLYSLELEECYKKLTHKAVAKYLKASSTINN